MSAINTGAFGLGSILGPILASVLESTLGYRWAFTSIGLVVIGVALTQLYAIKFYQSWIHSIILSSHLLQLSLLFNQRIATLSAPARREVQRIARRTGWDLEAVCDNWRLVYVVQCWVYLVRCSATHYLVYVVIQVLKSLDFVFYLVFQSWQVFCVVQLSQYLSISQLRQRTHCVRAAALCVLDILAAQQRSFV